MRIRTAIFGVYVAASAAGFCVLMALVLRDVRVRYMESMRLTLGDAAALLASAARDAGGERWFDGLARPSARGELRVFATDADGRVLADSAGQDSGKIYADIDVGAERYGHEARGSAVVEGEMRVWVPRESNGRVIGYVGVGRALDGSARGIARARWRLAAVGAAVAGVMLLAGGWIARRLTRSLERLTVYVQQIGEGRETPVPTSRAAEVTTLGQAFERMRRKLEGKAYVERYTSALAHEIKAPLAAIRGAAELLHENPPAAERERFLCNLETESERIQTIVDRLLELSAVEARHGRRKDEEIDLRALADEVADSVRLMAAKRAVHLAVAGGAVRVLGERFLLSRAIGNLVQNAVEFTPDGDTVRVFVRRAARGVEVVVEDEGAGIPAFATERIFERFYSLPRPASGRKSTGLGLSFVAEAARLHGGTIEVRNRAERGVRAVLTLPRATG